jgi:hypothetical protein
MVFIRQMILLMLCLLFGFYQPLQANNKCAGSGKIVGLKTNIPKSLKVKADVKELIFSAKAVDSKGCAFSAETIKWSTSSGVISKVGYLRFNQKDQSSPVLITAKAENFTLQWELTRLGFKQSSVSQNEQKKAELAAQKAQLAVEAETKARIEAETKARIEAETKARIEAETKARIEAETKARIEAETKVESKVESKVEPKVEPTYQMIVLPKENLSSHLLIPKFDNPYKTHILILGIFSFFIFVITWIQARKA